MYKKLLFGFVIALGGLGFLVTSCGPAGPGEKCETNPDCVGGYSCVKGICKTKTIIIYPDAPPADEPKVGEEPTTGTEGTSNEPTAGTEATNGTEPTTGPEPGTGSEPANDASTGPEPGSGPEPSGPEPGTGPEQTTPEGSGVPLTLYEINDPTSGKQPADYTPVETTPVVVTTPAVRLSSTLSVFFVQEEKQRNGSYQYGGMMIVYDRTKFPSLQASLGTIYKLKGSYFVFRSVDWKSSCTTDADCSTQKTYTLCKQVYDSKTQQRVNKCASPTGMPQIELSEKPTWAGNTSPPAPTVVKPSDVNTGGPNAMSMTSVLLEVKSVVVSNANPDDPRDYGEFSVAESAGSGASNELRVDDMINTIQYTGSKFCFGCGSTPKKPDASYCLPGDTCNCKGRSGRCYSGTETADQRKKGDTFTSVIGVLRYANGHFKLNPRLPTDLQK